jgi:hypothetical protein
MADTRNNGVIMAGDILFVIGSFFLGMMLLFWPVKFLRFFYKLAFLLFQIGGGHPTSNQKNDYDLLYNDPDLYQQNHRSLFLMLWLTGAVSIFLAISYLCQLSSK